MLLYKIGQVAQNNTLISCMVDSVIACSSISGSQPPGDILTRYICIYCSYNRKYHGTLHEEASYDQTYAFLTKQFVHYIMILLSGEQYANIMFITVGWKLELASQWPLERKNVKTEISFLW